MKHLFAILSLLTILTAPRAGAQTWTVVGSAGFTIGDANYTDIAIDRNGTPYVVYSDALNDFAATVMKYNGSSWVYVGSPDFATGYEDFTTIAINSNGIPYVACTHDDANAWKYNGSSWVAMAGVPIGFSDEAQTTDIAIDKNDTPFVVYADAEHGNKATVKKFDGTNWMAVGIEDFSAGNAFYTSIAIDTGGTLYVAYGDGGNGWKATVMKYNGSSWVSVGSPGFSDSGACYTAIAIGANDTPYVVYTDTAHGYKATVKKYDGTNWVTVGTQGFSAGAAAFTSIAFNRSGMPYVLYEDGGHSNKATVMRYNGSTWVNAGSAGFSAALAYYPSLAIDSSGAPYAVYNDGAYGGKATVMKLQLPAITGTHTVCAGTTTALANTATGGLWSSSNASVATISSTGIVTGIATGVDTIYYMAQGLTTSVAITISSLHSPEVTVSSSVCAGSTTALSAIAAGTWSSSNSHATVTGGIATGVSAGADTILNIVNNGCGIDTTAYAVSIRPRPAAGAITGTSEVCAGSTLTLSDTSTLGSWSASNANASVLPTTTGSTVTGAAAGMDTLLYVVTNSCGADTQAVVIIIDPLPDAGTITGADSVCPGAAVTWTASATTGTWSITNAHATVTGGTVTGTAPGADTVLYVVSNGCGNDTTMKSITVKNLSDAGMVTGADSVCIGAATTLSGTVAGGTWSSTNTLAAVTTGTVTGISAGTDTIRHIVINSCGSDTAVKSIVIKALPDAGTVTGADSVCAGAATLFSATVAGGVWSSTNTLATVTTGTVTGISAGTDTIRYIVINTCGSDTAVKSITVKALPDAGMVTGADSMCAGATTLFLATVAGGVWNRTNTLATVTTGTVTGISAGTDTIRYIVMNSCGSDTAMKSITIKALPIAGTITGADSVCAGAATLFSATVSGGVWSSTNTLAAVTTGTVTGINAGTDTIRHIVINSCGSDTAVKSIVIKALPDAGSMTGADSVCAGAAITLTDTTTGGAWSSSSALTTVLLTGTVTGVSAGTDTVRYIVINTCGSDTAMKRITVKALPDAAVLTGGDTVCQGDTIYLSASISGGMWSVSSTSVASVTALGIVSGLGTGTDTVLYVTTTACGSATTEFPITVRSHAACTEAVQALRTAGTAMQLFPNPATTEVTITYTATTKAQTRITIANILGQTMITQALGTQQSGNVTLSVSSLPAGVYMVTLTSGNNKVVRRLVKE